MSSELQMQIVQVQPRTEPYVDQPAASEEEKQHSYALHHRGGSASASSPPSAAIVNEAINAVTVNAPDDKIVTINTEDPAAAASSGGVDKVNETNVDLTRRQIFVVFGCLVSCVLLVALDMSVIGTAGPTIVREFGDYDLFAWIVSSYLLAASAVTPIYGKISDIFGRHHCFQFAIATFFIGSLLCSVSQSMIMLAICRAIQGIGGGGIPVLTQTVVGDMLAPAERGKYQGIIGSVTALASIAGPLFGGLLTQYWTWRAIFYINLPFCALASLLLFRYLRVLTIKERHVTSWRDIDIFGSMNVILATVSFVMAIVWGGSVYSWSSPAIILLFVAAAVLYFAFICVEHWWGLRALIPLHMFLVRNFTLCFSLRFFAGCLLYSVITYLPSYFQIVSNDSATISGVRTVPVLFTAILGSIIGGQSIARSKHWKVFPLIGTGMQVIGVGLLTTIAVNTPFIELAVYMILIGLGYGFTGPAASIVIQSSVPLADLASASAAGAFGSQLGGAIGTAVSASILNNLYASQLVTQYAERGLGVPPSNAVNLSGAQIASLGASQQSAFQLSYVFGLENMYYCVLAFALVQHSMSWFLKEVPLRGRKAP